MAIFFFLFIHLLYKTFWQQPPLPLLFLVPTPTSLSPPPDLLLHRFLSEKNRLPRDSNWTQHKKNKMGTNSHTKSEQGNSAGGKGSQELVKESCFSLYEPCLVGSVGLILPASSTPLPLQYFLHIFLRYPQNLPNVWLWVYTSAPLWWLLG